MAVRSRRTAGAAPTPVGRGLPSRLDLRDVDRLGALGPCFLLIGDLRSLGQRAISVAVDAAEMDEQVPSSIIRRDEAEALVVAEPLDGSRSHVSAFPSSCSIDQSGGPGASDLNAHKVAGLSVRRTSLA